MLDRELQLRLMQHLAGVYPEPGDVQNPDAFGTTSENLAFQLAYLDEHGLLESTYANSISSGRLYFEARITAKGVDFLADDGGLGAILGVVTIKIHDDTLKQLIEARVLESDLPQPDKTRLIDQLKSLPAEATKHLALKLLDKGLEQGPAAMQWLETLIRSLA